MPVEKRRAGFKSTTQSKPHQRHVARMSGRGKGKSAKKAVSRSAKAGLQVSKEGKSVFLDDMQMLYMLPGHS